MKVLELFIIKILRQDYLNKQHHIINMKIPQNCLLPHKKCESSLRVLSKTNEKQRVY